MNKNGVKYNSITKKKVVIMEKNVEISILCDLYGKLLTQKQFDFLNDYYNNDLSLSEIAENNQITRQAVRDIIKKGEKTDKIFKISDIKHLKYDDEEGELEIFLTDDTQITLHAGFFESFERYEEFFALLKK